MSESKQTTKRIKQKNWQQASIKAWVILNLFSLVLPMGLFVKTANANAVFSSSSADEFQNSSSEKNTEPFHLSSLPELSLEPVVLQEPTSTPKTNRVNPKPIFHKKILAAESQPPAGFFVGSAPSSTVTSVPQDLPKESTSTASEVILKRDAATSDEPFEHLDFYNKTLKSVMPDDLKNPIVVGGQNDTRQSSLNMLIQGVSSATIATTATDTVIYLDAFPQTDLEYTLGENNLKENIVLKAAGHPDKFEYGLNLSRYDFVQQSSSTIVLYRKGKSGSPLFKMYTISAPIMTDANASSSADIVMNINGDILTLTPNAEWLSKATYPVKVDPSVEVNVLNVYSHPLEGEYWTIDFVTLGISDLLVSPFDEATRQDMQFSTLTCDGTEASSTVDSQGMVLSPNWACEGLGQIKFYDKKTGHHHMVFSFGGSESNAYNGNNLWVGGASGDWETPGNWSLGTVPSSTDDVVIDTDNAIVDINAATSINSLTIGGGAATSTLNFKYDAIGGAALSVAGDLNVLAKGSVTHSAATAGQTITGSINISVGGNANITGSISADAKGFVAKEGPGAGNTSPYFSTGASHGGLGGLGGDLMTNGTNPDPNAYYPALQDESYIYDSLTNPVQMGSGGGNVEYPATSAIVGGSGGGAIKLTVTGTTTVLGTVSANAEIPHSVFGGYAGSGGSGGSVNLVTGGLSGTGKITVNGGDGAGWGSAHGAYNLVYAGVGGGSGGRIAVSYSSDSSLIDFQTHGGGLTNYVNRNGAEHTHDRTLTLFGGSGTLYKKSNTQTHGELVLNNHNGISGASSANLDNTYGTDHRLYETQFGKTPLDAVYEFDALTVKNAAFLYLPASGAASVSSTQINLQNWGALDVTAGKTIHYSSINWSSGIIKDNGGDLALLHQNQDLMIPGPTSTTLVINTPGHRDYNNVTVDGQLTVGYQPNITTTTSSGSLLNLDWNISGDLSVGWTGSIDVSGKGFPSNEGPGAGVASTTQSYAQGGSYGGKGGDAPFYPEIAAAPVYWFNYLSRGFGQRWRTPGRPKPL